MTSVSRKRKDAEMMTERALTYEVVTEAEVYPFPSSCRMAGFARELERKGIAVRRCQMRSGATMLTFKRSAWAD